MIRTPEPTGSRHPPVKGRQKPRATPARAGGAFGGLNAFAEKAHEWLRDLTATGSFLGESQAYTVLHAVLQTLRDRLTVDEAAQLGAQLPVIVRGVYYEDWKPARNPLKTRTRQAFLACVADRLGNCEVDPEAACRAVFELLARRVSRGEIEEVWHMLPADVRTLWPAPVGRSI